MTSPATDRTHGGEGQARRGWRPVFVQGADLGQQRQDQRCRDRPQAGDGAENPSLARGGLILGNLAGNLGIQPCDLTLNQGQARFGLAFQHRVGLHMTAIGQAGVLLDQAGALHLQMTYFIQFLSDRLVRFQRKCGPRARQNPEPWPLEPGAFPWPNVDRGGFGTCAAGFGAAPRL